MEGGVDGRTDGPTKINAVMNLSDEREERVSERTALIKIQDLALKDHKQRFLLLNFHHTVAQK